MAGASPVDSATHDVGDRPPDTFGGLLNIAVREMGVAQRHAGVGMTEQAGDHRHWHAVHHRVAGMGMTEIVETNILDTGFPSDPIPEPQLNAARAGGVERRRKHERARAARLAFKDAPSLRVERNRSRSGLAVG